MGIKNLLNFFRKNCPEVLRPADLSMFSYQRCAVDIASYLYKWKYNLGERWILGLIQMLIFFKTHNVHAVIVFDAEAPPEKKHEQAKRRQNRQDISDSVLKLNADLEKFKSEKRVSPLLKETWLKICKDRHQKSLFLSQKPFDPDKLNVNDLNPVDIFQYCLKKECQLINVSKDDLNLIRQFLNNLSVPWVNGLSEAEATCSWLCQEKKVDFVISEDSDNIAYCCPMWVTKLNLNSGECLLVYLNDVLQSLQMNKEQLVDWCIGCGCDYNSNMMGIGNSTMYNLIRECGNIDNIQSKYNDLDCSILNHIQSRRLFAYQPTNMDLTYWDTNIDYEDLLALLQKVGCADQYDMIQSAWSPVQFEFEDDNEY